MKLSIDFEGRKEMDKTHTNKVGALIAIGMLEVKCENSEKLYNEVSNLRESLLDDKAFDAAVNCGHLKQMLKEEGINDVDENVNEIYEYILEIVNKEVNDNELNEEAPLEHLGLNTRTYHVLMRNNIATVGQLLNYGGDLRTLRGMGSVSIADINNRLSIYGLQSI